MPRSGPLRSTNTLRVSGSRILVAACCLGLAAMPLAAKDASVTAIVLFDGPSGAAYVQITGVMLNGKAELRNCTGTSKIDRSTYGKLPKMQLKGATALDLDPEGVLILTTAKGPTCVVPGNFKFETKAGLSPAEIATRTTLQGTVVSASAGQASELPALKPGVRFVFVSAADTELAEFLRAQRARSTALWLDFLSRYSASSRTGEARQTLAGLFVESADSELTLYRKSLAANASDLSHLRQAEQNTDQAISAVAGYPPALKLKEQIDRELETLTTSNRAEFQAYLKALQSHTPGYSHFVAAKGHNDQILDVNPRYAPALSLNTELVKEANKLESTLLSAEALAKAKRYDDAWRALGPYRFFTREIPRVEAVVTAVYTFHFNRGQEFSSQQDWEHAVAEFGKAVETSDNPEATSALQAALIRFTHKTNHAAADHALEQSKAYAEQKQYIEAYEVLANLPAQQRALVADQLEALKADYITAAAERAQKIQDVHIPIRGRADEDAVRQAYDLFSRAITLSDDQAMKLKLDLLSDKISAYYVEQAKRYLEKPLASGVGLGWCYLGEAERYRQNLAAVKDEMTRYESAYQLRARLSIGVAFRDQTSRRESVGFADQLADAIATDLESSGLPVKVVRQSSEGSNALQPSYLLVGEINEHRTVKTPTVETLQSKYRAGTREVKNEDWLRANRAYEAVQQEVNLAQHALDSAVTRKKNKEIAAAQAAVLAAQKKLEQSHSQLDAIDQTRPQDLIQPYNYTKKTIDLAAVVQLAFRITDLNANLIEPATPLRQENHRSYVVLENVKAEDTEGIKEQGANPDEIQFMTELEIKARDILIKSVHDKVAGLPEKILAEARKRARRDDHDGAAEKYVLYLNTTSAASSPEREEAIKFLREHFNVALVGSS